LRTNPLQRLDMRRPTRLECRFDPRAPILFLASAQLRQIAPEPLGAGM